MMESKKRISLLGCGWLGYPLAERLVSAGYSVRASTTSVEKLEHFRRVSIDPYLVQFSASAPYPELRSILDADTLVVSIPPGRKNQGEGFPAYRKMVDSLVREIPFSPVNKLIFISSTSVYPESNSVADESAELKPATASGKLIVEAEKLLQDLPVKVIVLRLAGLIGPQRMPGRFFSGKKQIASGFSPVNLIHRDDAVRLIHCLIEDEMAAGIFNGCAPSHPAKAEFYTLAAAKAGLEPPLFIPEKNPWKIVSGERAERELDFRYHIRSLMDWIDKEE